MHNVAPANNQARPVRTLCPAFLSAVVSLATAFAASAAPVPLFNIYRAEDGFTNADISLAVVVYDLPTLVALLVMGRLSNHLGRRPTSIASLGLLVLGCLLLLLNVEEQEMNDIKQSADDLAILEQLNLFCLNPRSASSAMSL